MSRWRKNIGELGEAAAQKYLQEKGYKIIAQNYTSRTGEIDLIAKEKGTLVFVEVRTKTSAKLGLPEESITREKMKRLTRLARQYMAHQKKETQSRIDLVAVELDSSSKKVHQIRHLKGIY